MTNPESVRKIVDYVYLKGCADGLNPIIKDRQAQAEKIVDQALQQIRELITENSNELGLSKTERIGHSIAISQVERLLK